MMTTTLLLVICFACTLYAQGTPICPAGIRTFSAGPRNQSYFKCKREGDVALVKMCPKDYWYWANKESCFPRSTSSHNDLQQYMTPVLGRTVYLGCVIDSTKNVIHPAISFWSMDTVRKSQMHSKSYSSSVSFFEAESTLERMAHMDISSALKLELIGGLVSVEGSASYIKDSVDSEDTITYVMKVHFITTADTLPIFTKKDFQNACDIQDITHVVTSLSRGMDAYFTFTKYVKINESKEQVREELASAVKLIPALKGDGTGEINGRLKELTEEIEVKLRGDFILKEQPTTYKESIMVYKRLTEYLGTAPEYDKSSIMKMTLTPVGRFCKRRADIFLMVSQTLNLKVARIFDSIEGSKLKVKKMQMSDAVRNYAPLKKIMHAFKNALEDFETELKGELQTVLPKIRRGEAGYGEKDLVNFLSKYNKSPFNDVTCAKFLDTRQREIKLLDFIINPNNFKETQVEVVDYKQAGDAKTLLKKKEVMMIRFNILPNVSTERFFFDEKKVDESNSWFNNKTVVAMIGRKLRSFMEWAETNKQNEERGYLVALNNKGKKYVDLFAQRNGEILTDDFVFPPEPPMIKIISNEYDSIIFSLPRPHNTWVTGFILQVWNRGRKHESTQKTFSFKESSIYEVTGLFANEVYMFAVQFMTVMGNSIYGPESPPIATKPCSIPSSLTVKSVLSTSVTMHWNLPSHIGESVHIVDYEATVTQADHVILTQRTGNARNTTFKGLKSATNYNVSVQAIAGVSTTNGLKVEKEAIRGSSKAWLSVVTSPDHPSQLHIAAISYHSSEIAWAPPVRIAVGAALQEYLVKYVLLNNFGNKTVVGRTMVQSAKTNTSITLQDLLQGSTYGISVKVVTSMGASEYSSMLIVKTRFKESELDVLRHTVEKEINHVTQTVASLQKQIDAGEKQITAIQKNVTKNADGLNQKHDLVYIGKGVPNRDRYESKYPLSLDQCLNWCAGIRAQRGRSWNGVLWRSNNEYCECYLNAHGFNPANIYVYYRFV